MVPLTPIRQTPSHRVQTTLNCRPINLHIPVESESVQGKQYMLVASPTLMPLHNRPEDQTVLEEEYKQNPRPGKAARHDITSRVSLSDKEVQVGQRPGASIRQMMLPEVDEPESKHTLVRVGHNNYALLLSTESRLFEVVI